jgi:hypothetical protein
MGGIWSGERLSKKPVVEGRLSLDTSDLKRLNLLVPGIPERTGSLNWFRGDDRESVSSISYTLTVGEGFGTFRLHAMLGQSGERFDCPVRLVATDCHLGGVRWWFVCPLSANGVICGRRVRKLYLRGNDFGCRHCHRLTYTSSQQSDSRVHDAVRGGKNAGMFGDPRGMSITRLGVALKAVTLEQRRLDRLGRRLDRGRRGSPPKGDADRLTRLSRNGD